MSTPTNITEDDLYNIDLILTKSNIDKEAFFNIIRLFKITDRREEFKILNYFINLKPYQLDSLAKDIRKLRGSDKL